MEFKIHIYLILRSRVFNQMLLLVKLNIPRSARKPREYRTVVEIFWDFELRYNCHQKHSEAHC